MDANLIYAILKKEIRELETEGVKACTTVKTTNEWLNNPDYLPKKGEIIVYSDYQTVIDGGVTKNVPSLKIGDGINAVRNLAFINMGAVVEKLQHSLTIGSHVFDGSADIVVPVYDGGSN